MWITNLARTLLPGYSFNGFSYTTFQLGLPPVGPRAARLWTFAKHYIHPLDWIYTNFINNVLINISIRLSFSVSPIFICFQWVESGISPEALIADGQAPLDASAFTVWTFMNIGDIHLSIQKLITPLAMELSPGASNFLGEKIISSVI